MSDIRDWDAFKRGRWNWTAHGYERGFPRGCGFTDIDAAVEFDGHCLFIEGKHHDGTGEFASLSRGQRLFMDRLVSLGVDVFVLYGNAPANDPQGLYDVRRGEWADWRGHSIESRRQRLKNRIDRAMGLLPSTESEAA